MASLILKFFRGLLGSEARNGPPSDAQVPAFDMEDAGRPVGTSRNARESTGERLPRETSYTPRPTEGLPRRSGDPAKEFAKIGANLIRAIGEGNNAAIKAELEGVTTRAKAFKAISERQEQIGATVGRIQKIILCKDFAFAAQISSTLAQDASLLTDDVVLMSTALLRMVTSLEKAVTENDLMSASRQIEGLISIAGQFDQAALGRADQLLNLVTRLDRAVKTRDFALITSLSGILARDATIVAAFIHEDVAPALNKLPEDPQLENMIASISEYAATHQYTALASMSRLLMYRAGLFSDPVMAQAVQLNQIARQLRQALLEGKRDVALALSGIIARSAGIFRGPILERTNQLLDQCLALEQAAQHHDYAAIANLAGRVTRTADLLTNAQVNRASSLVSQSTKLDQAIRRFDIQAGMDLLDGLQTVR